jgi:RNA polymerase sigma-70 factor (ECF subfamily)
MKEVKPNCAPVPEGNAESSEFATLYRATIAPLRRYLGKLLGNASEAQDVAHDAYLRVYRAASTDRNLGNCPERSPEPCAEPNRGPHNAGSQTADTENIKNPEALLFTAARRLAINRLKRRGISPIGTEALNSEVATCTAPGVRQLVMARQEMALLEKAIADLPAGCRAVLLLRKIDGLSHQDISDRLGIALSTVEKQHARALRLLKAALPPEISGAASADAATRTAPLNPSSAPDPTPLLAQPTEVSR